MLSMRFYIIILIIFSLFTSCADVKVNEKDKNLPNDVRWLINSSEYVAICKQIYMNALSSMQSVFLNTTNPIIIMDLDETVLDNSKYQIDLFLNNTQYNEISWDHFVNKEISDLVPGAKDFITEYKKHTNARIIYISNRSHATLEATKNNMKKLGVYFEDDIFLLRKHKEDTKVLRRNEVFNGSNRMSQYGPQKVLAYFGDAMGDFPKDTNYEFSINKFIFPNPMYGKW